MTLKFLDILQEIGINNPGKLKVSKYHYGIKVDNKWVFYNGLQDYFPNYWCGWFGDDVDNFEEFKQYPYFNRFKILKIDENSGHIFYGILKSQVEIVDKLQEIGINKPLGLDYKNAKFVEVRYKGPETEILHTGALIDMIDLGPYMAIIPPGIPEGEEDKYKILLYSSKLISKTSWQSGWSHFDPDTIQKCIDLIKEQVQNGNYKINY